MLRERIGLSGNGFGSESTNERKSAVNPTVRSRGWAVKFSGRKVQAFLANPDPDMAAVLLYGPDRGLVSERTQFLLAATVVLGACGKSDETVEERLRPVRYVTVSDGPVFRDRSFSGISKSSRESRLSFKVTGPIVDAPIQIGQRLHAGDLIAEIDPAGYVLQAQQAQATLVEAQANERRAAANYDRTKGLYANDNSSLNDLESARAEAE